MIKKKSNSFVDRIYFLLSQRRIWIFILSVLTFVATYLGYTDVATLIGVMSAQAGLALWSFNKPKQ